MRENVAFIDDCSYSIGCETAEDLSERLTREYDKIANYVAEYQLVLNDEKSHVMVFTNRANSSKRMDVFLKAGNYVIEPSESQSLL